MTKIYRPASSYLSQIAEKREQQLANLIKGRMMRGREAEQGVPSFKKEEYKIDPILFIEEQFFIPETKRPIVLTDWQKEKIFKPLFYVDSKPTMCLYGAVKKAGKSTISAAIASWFLFKGEENSELYLCASDKEQASWVTFNKLVKAIEYNKQMLIRSKMTSDSIEISHKRTVLRSIPTDASISGVNPNFVHFDELYLYRYEGMREFWEALTTVPTRKNPLTLITTTAGWDEDTLLYELYQKGLKGGDPTFYFLWDRKNRMKWQTKAYLSQQKGRLRKATFRRLHLNEWTSGIESFIEPELWDQCINKKLSPILPSREVRLTAGVDIGIKNDFSAVVAVTRNGNRIKLACHKVWKPSKENPLDLEVVEGYLRELNKNYVLESVVYDPFQFHGSAMRLKKEGLPMLEYPQTSDRLTRMGQLIFDLIKGGNLELYPDKEMRSQALHTKAKETQRGWRLVKGGKQKIDIIIALAMALDSIKIEASKPGRIYVDSGEALMDWEIDVLNAKKPKKGQAKIYLV